MTEAITKLRDFLKDWGIPLAAAVVGYAAYSALNPAFGPLWRTLKGRVADEAVDPIAYYGFAGILAAVGTAIMAFVGKSGIIGVAGRTVAFFLYGAALRYVLIQAGLASR